MKSLHVLSVAFLATMTLQTADAQRFLISDRYGWMHGTNPKKIETIDLVNMKVTNTEGDVYKLRNGAKMQPSDSEIITIKPGTGTRPVGVNPLAAEGVSLSYSDDGEIVIESTKSDAFTVEVTNIISKTIIVDASGDVNLKFIGAQPVVKNIGGGNFHFTLDASSALTFVGNPGEYTFEAPFPLIDIDNSARIKDVTPYISTYNCERMLRAGSNISVGSWIEFKTTRSGDTRFSSNLLCRLKVKDGVNNVVIGEKPRYIWIDAGANFKDFADSKEKILRDLTLARDAGFTDIVVDVRSTSGDVLFKTDVVDQVKYLLAWVNGVYGPVYRTATWDYLQAFIDASKQLGLRVHAAINTMACAHRSEGLPFRDSSKRDWVTTLNTESGLTNMMDLYNEYTKFFNPGHPEVQEFLCNMLRDLAKYDLDGIFLDRGRYHNFTSDFSELSRSQFEDYIGEKVENFPADVFPAGATTFSNTKYGRQWLEFRAKTIHDFMVKARDAVKEVNPDIKFGVYVGGWYGSYYDYGVNWASPTYDPSTTYWWASAKYKDYGFADHMDQMLIGAYANPSNIYGNSEWSVQGFNYQAMNKIGKACEIVAGGPDVGNWNLTNITPEQEINGVKLSVDAAMSVADGYFLFDMIHLKLNTAKWDAVTEGFDYYENKLPKF